ncbi:hypothetical protein [Desulfosporosinus fructosivorans]
MSIDYEKLRTKAKAIVVISKDNNRIYHRIRDLSWFTGFGQFLK